MRGEHLALVGGHQNVIGRRLLREDRHLLLDLDDAAVRATPAAGVFECALLHDASAEAGGRTSQSIGITLVLGMRTHDQEPSPPILPRKILSQPIGQHRPSRRGVDHVCAAILFAQSVVDSTGIEQYDSARPAGIRRLEKRVGRKIGDDEGNAAIRQGERYGCRVVPFCELHLLQRKALFEKPARRIVIFNSKLSAGHAVVLRRHFNQGDRCFWFRTPQIPDFDLGGLSRQGRRKTGQHTRYNDGADHGSPARTRCWKPTHTSFPCSNDRRPRVQPTRVVNCHEAIANDGDLRKQIPRGLLVPATTWARKS